MEKYDKHYLHFSFRLVLIELQLIVPESFISVYETSLMGKNYLQ